jgi:cell division protein FtsL
MAYVAVLSDTPKKVRIRRHAIKFRMQFGVVSLTVVTIALSVVLSLLYFMQVNHLTLSGYDITRIESQIRELKDNNKKLEYEISGRQALNVIDQQAKGELQMVPAAEVQYWWKSGNELAQNN